MTTFFVVMSITMIVVLIVVLVVQMHDDKSMSLSDAGCLGVITFFAMEIFLLAIIGIAYLFGWVNRG